jgi:hypothetical protein
VTLKPLLFFPAKDAWPRDDGTLDLIGACPVGWPVRGPFPALVEMRLVIAVLVEEAGDGEQENLNMPIIVRLRGPKGHSDAPSTISVRPTLGRGSRVGSFRFTVHSHGRHHLLLLDPEAKEVVTGYPLSLDHE